MCRPTQKERNELLFGDSLSDTVKSIGDSLKLTNVVSPRIYRNAYTTPHGGSKKSGWLRGGCFPRYLAAPSVKEGRQWRGYRNPRRGGAHVDKLIVCAYPVDRRLCPVLYIKEYLKRTKLLRQSDQFFVQCTKPYKGVSRDTIRRWTKQVLRLSGVDTVRFKAHSTRAAATSLADFRHVPMDTILKFAG